MQEVKFNLTTQLKVTKQMVKDASLVAQATTRFLSYILSFFGPFYLSHQCIFFIMFQLSLTIAYMSYKNRQKSTLAFNGGWNSENHQFWWWTEFHHVFPFCWAPPLLLHIFSLCLKGTTTIICLEPCALNAEYQHFILRFIKMSLLCGYHWKRG